jgi:REP element-mobilizing transposase RayT
MGTFLRIYNPDYVHFVTNRCEHEMFFLLPLKAINQIVKFWLAKAKQKWGKHLELYGFCFLSNHFHLFLSDPRGELARFMCYFQGNVAKAVNKVLNRNGKFWSREYDDVIVDGEDEFWDRYSYTMLNAVKSGLVATPAQWKGLSSYKYVIADKPVVATGINVSRYTDAKRHGRTANKKDFEETFSFELAVPPMLKNKSASERIKFIKELVVSGMAKYKKDRLYKPALGMDRVMRQNPFGRPRKSKRTARFKFMSFSKERRKELHASFLMFTSCYKNCVHNMLSYFEDGMLRMTFDFQTRFPWPEGSYPPTSHRPTGII